MQTPLSANLLSVPELILVASDGKAEASAGSMEKRVEPDRSKERETFRFEGLLFRLGRPLFHFERTLFHFERTINGLGVPWSVTLVPF